MGILNGKVIIVTGATSGIGCATAIEAAKEGAKVVLAGRRKERGEAVVASIRAEGGTAIFVPTDVTVEEDVKNLVATAVSTYGGLDGAFNNAGSLATLSVLENLSAETFEKQLQLNLTSVFLCLKHEIPEIRKRGSGSIVNCGSIGSTIGAPMFGAYAATKFGIAGLTRVAALDHAAENIRINVVMPGAVETEIWDPHAHGKQLLDGLGGVTPMKRYAKPIEIAKPVVFLLSDGASYITGAQILIDGGYTAQ